jgi:hypothetical protein
MDVRDFKTDLNLIALDGIYFEPNQYIRLPISTSRIITNTYLFKEIDFRTLSIVRIFNRLNTRPGGVQ